MQKIRYPNRLKALVKEAGLTIREVHRETGIPESTLRWWANGSGVIPSRERAILARLIGCDIYDLAPLHENELTPQVKQESVNEQASEVPELGSDEVDRRKFLEAIGTASAALFVSNQPTVDPEPWERFLKVLRRPSTIDETTLSHLEALVQNSWQLTPDITGVVFGELRDYIVNHLLNITELLEGSLNDATRKRLISIGGEFSMIAASMSANLRDFNRSLSYYNASIDAAREAGNYPLGAVGLASLAIRLTHHNQAVKALPLILEARRIITQNGTTTTRTWLAAVEAEVQANLKDYTACFRALEEAENVPQQYVLRDDPYMTTFSPFLFAGYKGVCHMQFNESEAAYKVLHEALTYLDAPSISRRCYILTDLARACIKRKEIVEACTYATQALILTAQAKSPALWQHINDISRQLEPWNNTQAVQDFNEQLLVLLTQKAR